MEQGCSGSISVSNFVQGAVKIAAALIQFSARRRRSGVKPSPASDPPGGSGATFFAIFLRAGHFMRGLSGVNP